MQNHTIGIIGRSKSLFRDDIANMEDKLSNIVGSSSFLVIGGAGSIGQSVTREIFRRQPKVLHVVDINENNLVELVRDLRSSLGYIKGDFKTFTIDSGSIEFQALLSEQTDYDFVLNLSALKHVRSEKDPYTLMRMTRVNILNTIELARYCSTRGVQNIFCVSSDKATKPINLMGASKRIMELVLIKESSVQHVSMARFANVAFSDGSLLHGFKQRISKEQPIAAPKDIKRYFITPRESGELCLMSAILGNNRDVFYPKINLESDAITFSDIAQQYLISLGYDPYICDTEEEARSRSSQLLKEKKWPCYFFDTDTTGEKYIEEFTSENDKIDLTRFADIGVIQQNPITIELSDKVEVFVSVINHHLDRGHWTKKDILSAYESLLPEINHAELGKSLEDKM